jgi:hypothetical protein
MLPGCVVVTRHFSGPLALDGVRQLVKERLFHRVHRFQSQEMPLGSLLAEDLVQEVRDVRTPEDLDQFAARVHSRPMDSQLPLWRAYVMNDMEDGRSILCCVTHHCLADDMRLMGILFSIVDGEKLPQIVQLQKVAPNYMVAFLHFGGPLVVHGVRQLVTERLLRLHRFRRRAVTKRDPQFPGAAP